MEPQLLLAAGGHKAGAQKLTHAGETRGCRWEEGQQYSTVQEGPILRDPPLSPSPTPFPAGEAPTCAGARRALARG